MSYHLRALTTQHLADLPASCRSCAFWELADAPRGPRDDDGRAAEAKLLWVRSLELEWGAPGLIMLEGNRTLGYAVYMPAEEAHRARRLGSMPSDDALVLATLWVTPEQRGGGLAETIVHAVLRQAHEAGLRAVEAIAARGRASPCMVPEQFLFAQGFVVHHDHPRYPLLRLDLRQTVRWHDAVEHAIEGVRSVLRRERTPVPSSA